MNIPFSSLVIDTASNALNEQLHERAKKGIETREIYTTKLAESPQDDIFKYFLLVNLSAIETYVSEARLQAQSSFKLCKKVAYLSFLLIASGVLLGLWAWTNGKDLTLAQLTGLAGILTQFISGVFFYLYNKTLEQVNRFSDKLSNTQELALCFVANSNIDDKAKRDDSTAALAKQLLTKQTTTGAVTASNGKPNPEIK